MLRGKRAISPLVATVLLIAFSVALGAVVMSWGESYIEERAQFVSGKSEVGGPCSGVVVSVITLAGKPQACYRAGAVEVFIEAGTSRVDSIKARLMSDDGIHLVDNTLASSLQPKDSVKVIIPHNLQSPVKQIKLTPAVTAAGKQEFCTEAETVIENPEACS